MPLPVFAIDRVSIGGGGGASLKPAEISVLPSPGEIVSVHVRLAPNAEQDSPQPANVAFASGVAVNVTVESCLIRAVQLGGQLIDPLVGSGDGA